MSRRYSITTLYPTTEYEDGDQPFLNRLYKQVHASGKRSLESIAERAEKFHKDEGIPGSPKDWRYSQNAVDFEGKVYWSSFETVGKDQRPPFPQDPPGGCALFPRTPTPMIWHLLFLPPERVVFQDRFSVVKKVSYVRTSFVYHMWQFMGFFGEKREEDFDPPLPPKGSSEWHALRGLFYLYNFETYREIIDCLSYHLGDHSLLEWSFHEECTGEDDRREPNQVESFLKRYENVPKVMSALHDGDYAPLVEMVGDRWDLASTEDLFFWMAHGVGKRLAEYLLTENEEEIPFTYCF